MPKDYIATFDAFARRYLGRSLTQTDGLPAEEISQAERRLDTAFPSALSQYYAAAGAAFDLNAVHNKLRAPSEVEIADDFFVFMDENQSVVSWGFRRQDLNQENPVVWQRSNTPSEEWYSEQLPFTDFLESMFNWYTESGVWS